MFRRSLSSYSVASVHPDSTAGVSRSPGPQPTAAALQQVIIASQGPDSQLKRAVGADKKGKLSPLFYLTAIALSHSITYASLALYVAVALLWLIPDRRIQRAVSGTPAHRSC